MEKAREFRYPLYMCFVNLRKAYDSVNRDALWRVLQHSFHLPAKLVSIVRTFHEGSVAAIRAYGKTSGEFDVTSGVRQGCVLAPTLFNLYFDIIIRRALGEHSDAGRGVEMMYLRDGKLVGNRRKLSRRVLVTDLEYADDVVLVANSWEDLQALLTSLDQHCQSMGVTISARKTKSMAVLPDGQWQLPVPIQLRGSSDPVKVASSFTYLGSVLADYCSLDAEVSARISRASQAFRSLSRLLWYQKRIKSSTKIRIFKAVIIPTLLYGLECCVLLEPHLNRLQSFIMRCLRIILHVSMWDKCRNTTLRKLAKQ